MRMAACHSERKHFSRGLCKSCYFVATNRTYRATPRGRVKQREWAWKYQGIKGMTVDRYDAMFKAQSGVCAICGRPPNGKALGVDHDHASGEVRGLVCDYCNRRVLPMVELVGLSKIAAYLTRNAYWAEPTREAGR